MKKLAACFLTILSCGAAYALPLGNPSQANLVCDGLFFEGSCCKDYCCDPCGDWCDMFSVRAGFWGDYVYNRHLETDSGGDHADFEKFEIWTNAGILAINFCDRVDVFTTLGTTSISAITNISPFAPNLNGVQLDTRLSTAFSWSVGVDGVIWECGCTSLGGEFQYFSSNLDVDRQYFGGEFGVNPEGNSIEYREWQFGLGVSHRINMIVPYAGIKWSSVTVDLTDGPVGKFENKKNWGYAVGFSLVDCEKGFVTVEGRFADEKALHLNAQIRF